MHRSKKRTRIFSLPIILLLVGIWLGTPGQVLAATEVFDISLVELTGRPGHEGLFEAQGSPVRGAAAIARARFLGSDPAEVNLVLRDNSGRPLSASTMLRAPDGPSTKGTFYADFIVPSVPFTLNVTGREATGASFDLPAPSQRTFAPGLVALRIVPTAADVSPVSTLYVLVKLTNFGPANEFTVSLSDGRGGSVSPAVSEASLAPDSAGTYQFAYKPSPGATSFVTLIATATASGQASPAGRSELRMPISAVPEGELVALPATGQRLILTGGNMTTIVICSSEIDSSSVTLAGISPDTVAVVGVGQSNANRAKGCPGSTAWLATFRNDTLLPFLAASPHAIGHSTLHLPVTAMSSTGKRFRGHVPAKPPKADNDRGRHED